MASNKLRKLLKTLKTIKNNRKWVKIPVAFHKMTRFFGFFCVFHPVTRGPSRRPDVGNTFFVHWSISTRGENFEPWKMSQASQHIMCCRSFMVQSESVWYMSCLRKCHLRRLTSNICANLILGNRYRPHVTGENDVTRPKLAKLLEISQSRAKLTCQLCAAERQFWTIWGNLV